MQEGEFGIVTVNQADVSNNSFVNQGTWFASSDNVATIDQVAGSFQAYSLVEQDGFGHAITVTQSGADAYSEAYQGFNLATSTGNTAYIEQTAAGSSLLIQDGDSNRASVFQSASAESTILQGYFIGATNSSAQVIQTADGAYSYVDQDGDRNEATIEQSALDASRYVSQTGDGTAAFVTQAFNAGAVSSIVQAGAGNSAIVRQ